MEYYIVKEDNIRPLQWPFGMVIETHSGADGVIRVVSIKISVRIIKHNVKNLAVLIAEDEIKSSEINSQNL